MRDATLGARDLLPQHAPIWERMGFFLDKNEVPQALLFTGPTYANIVTFTRQLMARVACEGVSKPCGACQSCVKFIQNIHLSISQKMIVRLHHEDNFYRQPM